MRMSRDGHSPLRKIRMDKLAMTSALARQSPTLPVQAIQHLANLHYRTAWQIVARRSKDKRAGRANSMVEHRANVFDRPAALTKFFSLTKARSLLA